MRILKLVAKLAFIQLLEHQGKEVMDMYFLIIEKGL